MIKKRNIIVLKNMFLPQISVMKLMEFQINKLFSGEIEAYFEDLEDKLEHIVNDIKMLEEHISSIEDAFKSIIDIKTNRVMTFLAFFSAFMLPLTLITSFYGMNIKLPLQTEPVFVYILLVFTSITMIFIYYYFRKKGNI
jgi:magnesium transporter